MKRVRRKIILTGQRSSSMNMTLDGFQFLSKEYLYFDPVSLFSEIDWTNYEDSVDTLNHIYSKLFDEFVIENKTLVCYWPSSNFPDSHWFDLLSLAAKSSVSIEINYLNEDKNITEEIPEELQHTWKKFILEMVDSLSDDIKLNEGLEEVAHLKSTDQSIIIYCQKNLEINKYFYLTSSQDIFQFEPQYEFEKKENIDYLEEFNDFESLVEQIQRKTDLSSFESSFFNVALEKIYFNAILKMDSHINLIQNWVKNYSLN